MPNYYTFVPADYLEQQRSLYQLAYRVRRKKTRKKDSRASASQRPEMDAAYVTLWCPNFTPTSAPLSHPPWPVMFGNK